MDENRHTGCVLVGLWSGVGGETPLPLRFALFPGVRWTVAAMAKRKQG